MLDISTLSFKDTFTLQLRHPSTDEVLYADGDAKKQAVSFELYSKASKQYRNAVAALQNRQLRRSSKKGVVSAEVMQEEAAELLTACFAKANHLNVEGKEVTTEKDFRELMTNPKYFWIKDQVDEALGDNGNFLQK